MLRSLASARSNAAQPLKLHVPADEDALREPVERVGVARLRARPARVNAFEGCEHLAGALRAVLGHLL